MSDMIQDRGRVRFAEERDIGGVISTTFLFLRETWRELGLGLLYVAGPVLLLTAVASYFMQTRIFGMLGDLEAADPNDPTAVFDEFTSRSWANRMFSTATEAIWDSCTSTASSSLMNVPS